LRLLLDLNERLKADLELKSEGDARAVELRVGKALEGERRRAREEGDAREAEVKELHRMIGEYKGEAE
jgi:hypothetical protein